VINTVNSTYNWTVPSGATIVSGQGTNAIIVNFNGNFGSISVDETTNDGCLGTTQMILVNCNLSTPENQLVNVTVYPNPATQSIQLDFDLSETGQLYLYDLSGRLVKTVSVFSSEKIDIEGLESAVYFGNVIFSGNHSYLFQLVKQ
jgi:hypothetical protein